MTLPALDTWQLRGVLGPAYKVGPYCANPLCTRPADHAHHIVRRSQLKGDYAWVEITLEEGDTIVVGNLTGLCVACHDKITGRVGGHHAAIRYDIEEGVFDWCLVDGQPSLITYEPVAPLDPQPPSPESLAVQPDQPAETAGVCPSCGHVTRRRPAPAAAGRRRRKSWVIKVPDDHEDGAEVLDTLTDDLAPLFGYEAGAAVRYHTVAAALYYAHQNRRAFIESVAGKGA